MGKTLPYAPVFLNDLMGECTARGLGFRERGILLHLLWVQQVNGTIPPDLPAIRRLLGGDAHLNEVRIVVDAFFPLTADRRTRINPQHAEAWAKARLNYESAVRRGRMGAAQRWGRGGSADGSGIGSGNHNQNQSHNPELKPELNRGHPGESEEVLFVKKGLGKYPRSTEAEDEDDVPF